MKGTEKQIKWAEDIIASTRKALQDHKDYCSAKAAGGELADMWQKNLRIWTAISAEYEKTIAPIDSASVIIDNRKMLSADRMQYYFDQISTGHMPGFPGV